MQKYLFSYFSLINLVLFLFQVNLCKKLIINFVYCYLDSGAIPNPISLDELNFQKLIQLKGGLKDNHLI